MKITLNGEPAQVSDGTTVADLVHDRLASPRSVAVAVNAEVVRRTSWPDTSLTDGDEVEIVTARQGG